MKLTKEEEAQLLLTYDTWWKSYLNGDVKTYDSYLDEDFRFVGSTNGEEFLNRRDTTGFFEATADQLAGKAELRNLKRNIETLDGLVLITDLADAYVLSDTEWVFYSRFRFTSLLRKNKNGWKFIYQHFSAPDTKADEGETLGTKKITQENLELREAIKRRTVELEQKNRQLEIEAALERVRARAMGMQNSSELAELVDTVFRELTQLDFELGWCMINIIDAHSLSNTVWTINSESGKIPESFHMKFEDYPFHHGMLKAYKERKTKYIYVLEGDEKKDYDEYLFNETAFRNVPGEAKAASRAMEKYVSSFTFCNFGGLQTVGDKPLSDSNLDILERFGKVFDLTYTRFNDLLQAEFQAREAQIELALERVRARTMAMQSSEELQDTALLLFQQVEALGVPPFACGFNIWDADRKAATAYMGSVAGMQPPFKTDSSKDIYLPIHSAAQRGESLFVIEQAGKELENHYAYLVTIPTFRDIILENLKRNGLSFPTFQIIHCAFFSHGYLMFISYEPVTAFHVMFKRFAKVFEQTYTRFLDLQKAEAQAREATIEAALERVRSRGMAMHHSTDMLAVADVLFQQLRSLGGNLWGSGVVICTTDVDDDEVWFANEKGVLPPIAVPHTMDATHKKMYEGWIDKMQLFSVTKEGRELKAHYDYMLSVPSIKPLFENILASGLSFPEKQTWYAAYFNFGYILTITLEPYLEEQILIRFAKVFEQTYTRFLDLQNAEAQAREAKIEASLERVRSKAMAMHRSEELGEVATVLHSELISLNVHEFSQTSIIIHDEPSQKLIIWGARTGSGSLEKSVFPLLGDQVLQKLYDAWRQEEEFFTVKVEGKALRKHIDFVFPEASRTVQEDAAIKNMPDPTFFHCAFFCMGYLELMSDNELSEASSSLLVRFAKVFDQAYVRFLDLQKAEAQAREAQIEVSLERIRAKAMAMRTSNELRGVADTIREQMRLLEQPELESSMVLLYDEEKFTEEDWYAFLPPKNSGKKVLTGIITWPLDANEVVKKLFKIYKSGVTESTFNVKGKDLEELFKDLTEEHPAVVDYYEGEFPENVIHFVTRFSGGHILMTSYETPSEKSKELQRRVTNAFDLAYKRFLDLQKAEAQAREAQIEAALERVRSRSMGMHKSEELKDVVKVIFDQLAQLGINAEHAGIVVDYEPKKDWHFWIAEAQDIPAKVSVPYLDQVWDRQFAEAKKKGEHFFTTLLDFEEKNNFYKELLPHIKGLTKKAQDFYFSCPGLAVSTVIEKDIGLYIENFSGTPYSGEENDILMRFAKVFQQTYTRFLDLQKAEAQAREAQIEGALEKVRSRSIGMQKSEELREVIQVIHDQLIHLNFQIDAAGFTLDYHQNNDWNTWIANKSGSLPSLMFIPYIDHPQFNYYKQAKEKRLDFLANTLTFEEKNSIFSYMFGFMGDYPQEEKDELLSKPGLAISQAFLKNISLWIYNLDAIPYSEEENSTLMRFAKVFEQTYVRFNDLQKAEEQAREAQIETALEKVRSRSMAMHKTEELVEVVAVVAEKLQELGVILDANGVVICTYFPDSKDIMHWIAAPDFSTSGRYLLSYFDHPILNAAWESKNSGADYFSKSFSVEEKNSFYEYAFAETDYKNFPEEFKEWIFQNDKHALSFAWARHSAILVPSHTGVLPTESDQVIMKRFAKVFEQAYIRFMDLKNAEILAHKAKIEVALERVRARALAMQQPEELIEVAEVLRYEMGLLGVEELETCSIYINDEETGKTECWYALKDIRTTKKKLVSDHFPLDLKDTWVGREMKKFYGTRKKQVSIVMKGNARKEWINYCEEKSVPVRGYYGDAIPDRTYHLYKFTHGAIGAAAAGEISTESWDLLRRAASVFSLAYSRFKDLTQARIDLQQLKEEKLRAETALGNLKATQSQLIQSEKMASLGELTAGIAHEIQNPLNFVNNFSEVSNELLDEMNEEIEKGDLEEAKAIASDIKQNLEKIHHHGTRADAIVKGMLQHSRSSNGVKEPTDINALADEYLRLAYHGLRAKEKSFNATMKTDYDDSLEKVNVIPQDIGRVILNLITNAFYVVNEKSSFAIASEDNYEPTVWVSTKKDKNQVTINVRDNGNGIPKKVVDKIFQPFFTTKPTGQGTGLGLSLSYDIVKAHGGEITVKSKAGEGTTITIALPA